VNFKRQESGYTTKNEYDFRHILANRFKNGPLLGILPVDISIHGNNLSVLDSRGSRAMRVVFPKSIGEEVN
jgi:hypothetical protein